MVTVHVGMPSDVERINAYYKSRHRSQDADPEDFILLAEDDNKVIGVVRLCIEDGYLVLRGMDIEASYRRQGLGRQMLQEIAKHIGDRDCYCKPWKHLEKFYAIVGFKLVDDEDLPKFLQERLAKSRKIMQDPKIQELMQPDLGVYPENGLTFIGMLRPKSAS